LVVDEKNSQLFISVTDDGDGIQKKDLPHIFERFSFGNRSRWTDEPDTGVGLSLVKELVELQQGSVSVESTWGKGSCFTVKLPVAADETRGETDAGNLGDLSYTRQFLPVIGDNLQAAQPSANGRMAPKETLLIVEDHPDLQAYLANHLSAKYRILQAVNGLEGLHLAKTKNPDLIVCDIMMPKMDGIELVGLLKGEFHTSHIPIILLTAKSLEEHKIEGIKTGADDYITKPFNMVYLETRIANMLKQRKQLKERFSRDLQARPKELGLSPADQEFLEKVIQLVDENVPEPDFSVDNLLEHFNFGRTVFYKKMKGITGYSPKDFVRIERMKKAGTLLLDKDITVAEVSFKLGFNDPEYFSKLFKKHFGENPSEYQKRNKNIDASAVSMKISE
jgi:CheY-like chemotaxis protein/methylphosphotriester-DNA--protein-cysteine methyltransferase